MSPRYICITAQYWRDNLIISLSMALIVCSMGSCYYLCVLELFCWTVVKHSSSVLYMASFTWPQRYMESYSNTEYRTLTVTNNFRACLTCKSLLILCTVSPDFRDDETKSISVKYVSRWITSWKSCIIDRFGGHLRTQTSQFWTCTRFFPAIDVGFEVPKMNYIAAVTVCNTRW